MIRKLHPRDELLQRNALRLLCSNLIRPVTRVELSGLLDPLLFDDPLHRTVLEEIAALGEVAPARLRELLPARVTNRGFPEFDLQELLGEREASEDDIEELFGSVLQLIEILHRDEEVPEA